MTEKKKIDFCTTCRKERPYTLNKSAVKIMQDKEHTFTIAAVL